MDKFFDKTVMLQLSIFELRNLARELGVYSPTLLHKEELIGQMLAIINGESEPHIRKNKKGRPPKTKTSETIFTSLDTQEEKKFVLDEGNKYFSLGESTIAFLESNKRVVGDTKQIIGYLDIADEGYGFIRNIGNLYNKNTTYVSQSHIAANHLKKGDLLEANIKNLGDNNPSVLLNIKSINGKVEASRTDFEGLDVVYPNNLLNVDNTKFKFSSKFSPLLGSRNLIVVTKENKQEIDKFIKALSDANADVIFANVEALPERSLLLKSLSKNEYFFTTLEQSAVQHTNLIEFALSRAKRMAELGKNVVLFVDSLDKIVKNYNLATGGALQDCNPTLCKKLFAVARNLKIGSVSVIATTYQKTDNALETWLVSEFENIVDNIYR